MERRTNVVNKGAITTLTIILAVAILVAMGWFIHGATVQRYHSKNLVFEMKDPAGDDQGPGNYKYPTDSIFDPKSGHFDLLNFKVFTEKDNYLFEFEMGKVTNPWGAAEGFSHQMIQVYIANGSENGQIETLKEGANVEFSPKKPWNYLIKVVSFGKTSVYSAADHDTAEGKSKGVAVKLQPDKKTIKVTVPRKYLPGEPRLWSYYALVGSQDGSGPDNYRPVLSAVSRWNFGGGSNTSYHPNVIDVLAPGKGPHSQKEMLGSYDPARGRLALLYPVGPSGSNASPWEDFLEYMEGLFIKYDIKL